MHMPLIHAPRTARWPVAGCAAVGAMAAAAARGVARGMCVREGATLPAEGGKRFWFWWL